jgi:hypothetical protein
MNDQALTLPGKETRPLDIFYAQLQIEQLLRPGFVCLQTHRCNPELKGFISLE